MNSVGSVSLGTAVVCLGLATALAAQQPASKAPVPAPAKTAAPSPTIETPKTSPAQTAGMKPAASHADYNGLVKRYCVGCHNDRNKDRAGSLTLASFDIAKAGEQADVAERMIRKLQASMMPPPGAARPDAAAYQQFITALEGAVDTHAKANPNPGGRTFQRLNRPEYARAIKDLLEIDVDSSKWLPNDTMSANFDNIADEQALSPTLLESYLNAAADISRMAVGDRTAVAIDHTYTAPSYLSQHPWDHVPGTPYGTRGGMVIDHVFPADGEYVFEVSINAGDNARYEDIDLSIDGERLALLPYENMGAGGADGRGANSIMTEPVVVKAGQQKVAAAFVRRT